MYVCLSVCCRDTVYLGVVDVQLSQVVEVLYTGVFLRYCVLGSCRGTVNRGVVEVLCTRVL